MTAPSRHCSTLGLAARKGRWYVIRFNGYGTQPDGRVAPFYVVESGPVPRQNAERLVEELRRAELVERADAIAARVEPDFWPRNIPLPAHRRARKARPA